MNVRDVHCGFVLHIFVTPDRTIWSHRNMRFLRTSPMLLTFFIISEYVPQRENL
jgi:hypothetical protein